MRRPPGSYIIITATLLLIVFIPTINYFWDLPNFVGSFRTPPGPHEITIVTMYLNIGGFLKHGANNYFTPATYKKWMTTWGWLTNRVIAFFDNPEDLELFRQARSVFPADQTVLIKLDRKEIPAFKNLEKVRDIYQDEAYPKQTPGTTLAEYSIAMNAKYDVLQMAIQTNIVYTEHLAWLDIGYFRYLLDPNLRPKDDRFTLEVPENFNSSCVGMSNVTPRDQTENLTPWEYIRDQRIWVAGGYVLATKEGCSVMLKFARSYTLTVDELLDKNMSSTDQTVIGAMYSPEYIKRQPVNLVDYRCYDGQYGLYKYDAIFFCLGNICKEAAEKRLNEKKQEQVTNPNQHR